MKKLMTSSACVLALTLSLGSMAPVAPFTTKAFAATSLNTEAAAKADAILQTGRNLIGQATYSTAEYKPTYPYKFSCATFIMYIFQQNGLDIATYNEDYMIEMGEPVSRDQLQKGDLVFFDSTPTVGGPNHVGIYLGDNKLLHMADSRQNIVISDLNSTSYYRNSYVGARRVIPGFMPSNPPTQADKIIELAYSLKNQVKIGSTNNEAQKAFTTAGFINYVYKSNGINVGNSTKLSELVKQGTYVPKESLKRGDIVFFASGAGSSTPGLAGIYMGDHRVAIPSRSSGLVGRVLLFDYYRDNYLTARRVTAN